MNLLTCVTLETSWQDELKQLVRDADSLIHLAGLDPKWLDEAKQAAELFPLRCTRSFIRRMRKGDINDPLLKQVLPLGLEHQHQVGFVDDPLDEQHFNVLPGLVHKYHNRVLVVATGSCAINCRYCFRRNFAYEDNRIGQQQWQDILHYLKQRPEVDEVILSGGDPLLLSDEQLQQRINDLTEIHHIKSLRIHSRLPIVLPSRLTDTLIGILSQSRLNSILVVHSNHSQEIDSEVTDALTRTAAAGITLLNQAVLLKGVNDSAQAQISLSQSLFKNKVLPYYLHLLDPVNGAAHFQVSESDAKTIYQSMRSQLSGYLLPKLVKEVSGQIAKTPV